MKYRMSGTTGRVADGKPTYVGKDDFYVIKIRKY